MMDELNRPPSESSEGLGPSALDQATASLKQTTATTASVQAVTKQALDLPRLSPPLVNASRDRGSSYKYFADHWLPFVLAGVAWPLALFFTWITFTSKPAKVANPVPLAPSVRQSAITPVVLTSTSFKSLEDELAQSEKRLQVTSEALQLMSVRDQARVLLDESNQWRNR